MAEYVVKVISILSSLRQVENIWLKTSCYFSYVSPWKGFHPRSRIEEGIISERVLRRAALWILSDRYPVCTLNHSYEGG